MLNPQAALAGLQHRLDRVLLAPIDDVLDHRPGVEILEVHDLFVAVGVGHLEETVVVDLGVHPVDDLLDHGLDAQHPIPAELRKVVGVDRQMLGEVLAEDVLCRFGIGSLDLDLDVEPTGPQDRRVDHVLPVGGADHDDVLQPLHAVDLAEQLRNHSRFDVGADPGAAGPEDRVHLVEEDDHRRALGGLLPRPLEDQPDVTLGLADELVEQLGALDVEEVGLGLSRVIPAQVGHLLGQRVGDRLGDQRLAAARRAVEQHALGRSQRVFAIELLVQERQLDGVPDEFDLPAQSADVAVGDIRDLLQHEVLHLCFGNALEGIAGLGVDQQGVTGAELSRPLVLIEGLRDLRRHVLDRDQRLGQPDDALLVGMADDQCAMSVGKDLAQRADLADGFEVPGLDDGQRLVEPDRLALLEALDVDVGRAGQPHLAAGGEDVDGVVVLGGEQDAVPAGRLAEPVDLFAQRQQLLTGLLEGVHQLGVAGGQRVDARLELGNLAWAAGPAGTRAVQLLPQGRRLAPQLLELGRIPAGRQVIVGVERVGRGCVTHLRHSSPAPSPHRARCGGIPQRYRRLHHGALPVNFDTLT